MRVPIHDVIIFPPIFCTFRTKSVSPREILEVIFRMGAGASKIQPIPPVVTPPTTLGLKKYPLKKLLDEMEPKKMLFLGAMEGSENLILRAVTHGVDANDMDSITKMTPLHYAARYGHTHALEVLLKLGAQVNVPQKYGWRPVHEAAMYGKTECLDLLLRCGSHVNAKTGKTTKGNTPLHYAVKYGHLETAQLLVSCGAKVDKYNENHEAPLHVAAMRNEPECLNFLLHNGANIKARTVRDMDAAFIASTLGSVPCLRVLLRHEIDLNATYQGGYTLVHIAVINGRHEFLELLLSRGADIEHRTYDMKLTPLHVGSRVGQTKCIKVLLKHGANVNVLSIQKYTPLHHAIKRYQKGAAAILIDEGADVNAITEEDKYTPLHLCILAKDKETAELLMKAGADPTMEDVNYKTPIRLAYDNEMKKILTKDYSKKEIQNT